MQQGIFITGTDTDVGKTWLGQQLITALVTQGIEVVPKKPIESGWLDAIEQTDTGKLALAANKTSHAIVDNKTLQQVCLYRFRLAISPVRAAHLAKQTVTLQQLANHCFANVSEQQFVHIEGAGGFYSPIAEDGLNADLAVLLNLPIILVAEDRLGCINHILLTLEAAQNRGITVVAIFLNGRNKSTQKSSAMNNLVDLQAYTHIPIVCSVHEIVELIQHTLI